MKSILAHIYLKRHPNATENDIPYWYKRSIIGEVWHMIRKKICVVWAPNCALTPLRMALYRLCGFKIGKGTFIGMKCYLDDLGVDKLTIGNNVTISYGVYFTCHGVNQAHNKIVICFLHSLFKIDYVIRIPPRTIDCLSRLWYNIENML